jgi:endo-alpha-N-acetylgalactosaminidase
VTCSRAGNGSNSRAYSTPSEVLVTLSAPWQPKSEIRYTTDGSAPGPRSLLYQKPLKVKDTTRLRAGAFEAGKAVCLESEGSFVRLPPKPPLPDVYLGDLTPVRAVGPSHTYGTQVRWSAHSKPPQKDRSNEGNPLRLRGVGYARGMGVHAPNQLMYELKPEYERFAALAGVDERILEVANGSNRAMYPSVVFKVFLDGKEAAASPVMRIAVEPWRFKVKVPPCTRLISLVATDAGDGNKEDLANWVNAGFVLKRTPGTP